MRIDEAVGKMSKLPLGRVLNSVDGHVGDPELDEARELVENHEPTFTDAARIRDALTFESLPFGDRILYGFVLETLLSRPMWAGTEDEVIRKVREREQRVIGEAQDEDCLKYSNSKAVDTLKALLEVAVEDDRISEDEISLIRRLRRKLNLTEREQHLILARLGHFPQAGNEPHEPDEIKEVLNDLQRHGIVFYCNRHPDDRLYCIPDEIGPHVKEVLGVDLSEKGWTLLLENLKKAQLKEILRENGLPVSGTKDELIGRVLEAHLRPLESLDILTSSELYDLCGELGLKVGGSKQDRIDRIIDHFSSLIIKEVDEGAPPGEIYYEYLEELASREADKLRQAKVIDRDIDMDAAFEEGTRYLFEHHLELDLVNLQGSERPDGCLRFEDGKGLLMWDNKSKEQVYRFPRGHLQQFRRYIRNSKDPVSTFLILVPEVGEGAEDTAYELKAETDTDIAILQAADLKWLAQNWDDFGDEFKLEVLNFHGVLDRDRLIRNMKRVL